jgi:NAD+ synthase (glutamine-hydrolysing)
MKITIAQLNPVIGDIDGNLKKILHTLSLDGTGDSDLVVFPELFLTGYPPRDLLERPRFIERVQKAINDLCATSKEYPQTGILLGAPLSTKKNEGRGLYNAAVLIYQGSVLFSQCKSLLPTYDVFDETRYFDPAPSIQTVSFKNTLLGITICEDAWNDPELWGKQKYSFDPVQKLAEDGMALLINIAASPFQTGKEQVRYQIIRNHSKKHGVPVVFANQVGGNDELIFDGRSMFIDGTGELVKILPGFQECVETIDTDHFEKPLSYVPPGEIESIHDALVLGIRDYIHKCGFRKVVLGLSGGIDSAVTCCLAAKAIGPDNVFSVSMPSPYSSTGSIEDSRKLAENLGFDFKIIPISSIFSSYLDTLKDNFEGREPDVTEENIQARIRGTILMGLSNKYGCLLLSTGNKSEIAVGYCTLYGDMAGGLSVISDVPKTMVYQIAHYINRQKEIIPKEIIEKPPSAELRPDQKDQDSLPPYDVLDQILHYYVDEGRSLQDIITMGFDPMVVQWIIRAIDRSEYKRQQAAPGLKVTSKAFGMGRRMVIAAKYEG